MNVRMYVRTYVRMCICMYACVCVCVCARVCYNIFTQSLASMPNFKHLQNLPNGKYTPLTWLFVCVLD